MEHGSFRAAARAMAQPEAKSPEKGFVVIIKIGILLFTSGTYGEKDKKTTGLGLQCDAPVITAAVQNKRKLKLIVKQLLKMTFTDVKGVKGVTFTKEVVKEAFGPLAEKHFPDVWEQYNTPEK